MDALSLYLHIPFCRHRCAYCDFNTYTSLSDLQASYAQALCAEIGQVAKLAEDAGQKRPLHTIFFGGGTPSLMTLTQLDSILQTSRFALGWAAEIEISLEANPDTVDVDYLTGLADIGINRLSFGVQSAVADELQLLERSHDFETVVHVVDMARQAGLNNFNLDLIYGLPGQTLASWQRSLDAVLALEPPHLSLYCLTIEPGTPMQRWLKNGRISLPDPDLAADQYELACEVLTSTGLEHYEISNWSLPDLACRHNLTYWRNQEYLGLGAGAHGHANGMRYAVVKQPRVYIRRMQDGQSAQFPLSTAVATSQKLERREVMSDTIITQLRLLFEGLDLAAFEQQFGEPIDTAYAGLVAQLVEWGLLRILDGRLLLTKQGRFVSNQVFYRFM
ncbi:MAG: radical SAM family heme chaperone HemW [Anaerolineales bacterium]|nr:radical SAM family heme chaperone HemW [Anaerolineales bacterium]